MSLLILALAFSPYDVNRLGAAPITIIQETIWVRHFKKDGLALVLALGLTSGKLVTLHENIIKELSFSSGRNWRMETS